MTFFKVFLVLGLAGSIVYATDKAQAVRQKVSETMDAAGEYTKEQKEEVQKNFDDKMNVISAEIADLKKNAETSTGEVKKGLDEKIKHLEKKQKSLEKDMARWRKSSGKAWEEMKSGMSVAMEKLNESYQKAKKEFSDQKSEQ